MIKVIVGEDMEQFKRGLDLAFGVSPAPEKKPEVKKVSVWKRLVSSIKKYFKP